MAKRALITGITGQDGSYLAELLLDQLSLLRLIDEVRPHEIDNLAAMSFVPASWDQPMPVSSSSHAQLVEMMVDADLARPGAAAPAVRLPVR